MLLILLDVLVLMVLVRLISGKDVSSGKCLLLGVLAALAVEVVATALGPHLGTTVAAYVAILLVAVLLGLLVNTLFEVSLGRSLGVAALFMVAHVGLSLALHSLLKGALA